MSDKRKQPEERMNDIVDAGIRIAVAGNFATMTRETVAAEASISPSLVSHYFWEMDILRDAIITEGCNRRIACLILIGIARRHRIALNLPADVKLAALNEGN